MAETSAGRILIVNSPRSFERSWDVVPKETRVPLLGLLAVLAFAF